MVVVAGVDVGKVSLDVSVSEGPVLRFDNTARGITRLLKHLMEQDATMTVCESTGGYERLLVGRLRKAEIAVRVAHPSRVRLSPGLAATKPRPTPETLRCCPVTAKCSRMQTRRSRSRNARNCGTCCAGGGSSWNSESRS